VGHRVTHVATGVWHTVCVTVEPAAHQTSADSDQSNPAAIARASSEKAKEGAVAGAAVQQRPSAPAGQTAIADGSKPGHHRRSSKMRDKGVVWSWGGGDKGCLGVGDEDGRMEPERMHGGPESVRAVSPRFRVAYASGRPERVVETAASDSRRSVPASTSP
jgi:hypothetical protein